MPARTADRGYSGTPLPRKLGIKEGSEVLITAEGDGQRAAGPYDVIVLFAQSRAEVERRFRKLAANLEPNGRLWIGWPKRSSGISDRDTHALESIGRWRFNARPGCGTIEMESDVLIHHH